MADRPEQTEERVLGRLGRQAGLDRFVDDAADDREGAVAFGFRTGTLLAALVDGDGWSTAVSVVEGDRAKRVPVRVSLFADDRAALASRLEHESVVELGASRLEDGGLVGVTR